MRLLVNVQSTALSLGIVKLALVTATTVLSLRLTQASTVV